VIAFALLASAALAQSTGSIEGHVDLGPGPAWVYVDDDDGPLPPTPARAVLAQKDQYFTPSVLAVVRGTIVEFPNLGPDQHNVYWKAPVEDDLGTYPTGEGPERPFTKTGVYELGCNIHPRMQGWILVAPNLWLTEVKKGAYRLDGIPEGPVKLVVWSPRTTVVHDLTVVAGKATVFDVSSR
jgi:hypothetical protein